MKLCLLIASCALTALAQNPMASGTKMLWDMAKNNVLKAAEKMPEASYSFKPTPEVRSFGEIVGHVADANYAFCSADKAEKSPSTGAEKNAKTKDALIEALKASITYCDAQYASMTDGNAAETRKFFGGERTRINILSFNVAHDMEHYGNLVTYMRIRGLVPPSSEGR